MNKPQIYLADIIHNYVLSTDSFYVVPLNIGYIGAYLKESLKDSIEIKLFKYPDKLAEEIKMRPPDIIGFSFYTWNEELVFYFARKIKETNPNTLVVLGGRTYQQLRHVCPIFF